MHLVLGDDLEVGAGSSAGFIGPENFLGAQGRRCDAFREEIVGRPWLAFFDGKANLKVILFMKCDKAAAVAQKTCRSNDKCLEELIKIIAGIQLRRNLK